MKGKLPVLLLAGVLAALPLVGCGKDPDAALDKAAPPSGPNAQAPPPLATDFSKRPLGPHSKPGG